MSYIMLFVFDLTFASTSHAFKEVNAQIPEAKISLTGCKGKLLCQHQNIVWLDQPWYVFLKNLGRSDC